METADMAAGSRPADAEPASVAVRRRPVWPLLPCAQRRCDAGLLAFLFFHFTGALLSSIAPSHFLHFAGEPSMAGKPIRGRAPPSCGRLHGGARPSKADRASPMRKPRAAQEREHRGTMVFSRRPWYLCRVLERLLMWDRGSTFYRSPCRPIVSDLRRRRGRRRPSRSTAKPLRLSVAAAPYSSCRMSWPEGSRGERDAPRTSEPTGQQHLYLIFDDWEWGYSIRKLKLPLRSPHQPSLRPLEQRRLRRTEHKRLPPPCICLEAPRCRPLFFAAVGTDIIAAHPRNNYSNSMVLECFLPIVDCRSLGVRFGPGLLYASTNPILIPVGDDKLFALDMDSFRMLSTKPTCLPHEWSWCDLRLPPLKSIDVTSFAVGSNGWTIFASTDCATFAFDILNSEWKQSSNCSLPFAGPANYVHALDIFVGLSNAPDTYGHLCFCRKLSGDENVRPSKENLLIKDPVSHLGATLIYLQGTESGFCLVEFLSIPEGKSVNKWLEECDQLVKGVDEGGGNCGELDQLKKNVDEGDGASGSMQECGELDELKKLVDEGKSGSMHDRYLYRLTTFSLSFDNNGDLTTGETCVVQCYKVPKEVSEATYLLNPVAFWL